MYVVTQDMYAIDFSQLDGVVLIMYGQKSPKDKQDIHSVGIL